LHSFHWTSKLLKRCAKHFIGLTFFARVLKTLIGCAESVLASKYKITCNSLKRALHISEVVRPKTKPCLLKTSTKLIVSTLCLSWIKLKSVNHLLPLFSTTKSGFVLALKADQTYIYIYIFFLYMFVFWVWSVKYLELDRARHTSQCKLYFVFF
jgi:hypothetical protein